MKDKNGIEIKCKNCANYGTYLFMPCLLCLQKNAGFKPTVESYEARITELQKELNIVQESERAEAQEADRLRGEVKDLGKKLTETVKLLSETSRECGKLEAEVKVLKAFVIKVHTSPVIFEDVNRALRDEAKTLLEKLNQSAESEK